MGVQQVRIVFKRKTAAEWAIENPILMRGEPGYETDTDRMKIGNGITAWNMRPYFRPDQDIGVDLTQHIHSDTPHPAYDEGPSFALLYQNAKV